MQQQAEKQLFNSPFELGVRMVYLLLALRPRSVDLQRLVYLDYAAIYSEDLGGPPSLHTPVPLRGAEYLSRRDLIESGLYLMATKGLIDVSAGQHGIQYCAGENAAPLIGMLSGSYASTLWERCQWVARNLGSLPDKDLADNFGNHGLYWGAQLVPQDGVSKDNEALP